MKETYFKVYRSEAELGEMTLSAEYLFLRDAEAWGAKLVADGHYVRIFQVHRD